MALLDEVKSARKSVITDGYEMSVGEIINLYRDGELKIDPAFQRLFRWDDERKTRFVESILLGIPVPSIFVSQTDEGVWELVDGLQRVSTILQLTGDLDAVKQGVLEPLVLSGTKLLPNLDGYAWMASVDGLIKSLDTSLQIDIKRSRIRVEIIKAESDATAKFELFQRLNTGGVELTEQEVRNSIAISVNKNFYDWMERLSNFEPFVTCIAITGKAENSQAKIEYVLRFMSYLYDPYQNKLDVHEYLDQSMMKMALDDSFDYDCWEGVFKDTFLFVNESLGSSAFRRWQGEKFLGQSISSAFEVVSTGVARSIEEYRVMDNAQRIRCIENKVKSLWSNHDFTKYSGGGVRGTTRLSALLPKAADFMKP